MLSEDETLIFMNPRTELEMLRGELNDWEELMAETLDEELLQAYNEAKRVTVERINDLRRHLKMEKLEEKKKTLLEMAKDIIPGATVVE